MEGLVHLARRSDREEVDDVLRKLHRHSSHVGGRTNVPQHGKNLVLVDKFLRCQHGLFRIVARVFKFHRDFAAVDAAQLVGFINALLHALANLFAKTSNRAGQVLDGAQHNLVFGHTL